MVMSPAVVLERAQAVLADTPVRDVSPVVPEATHGNPLPTSGEVPVIDLPENEPIQRGRLAAIGAAVVNIVQRVRDLPLELYVKVTNMDNKAGHAVEAMAEQRSVTSKLIMNVGATAAITALELTSYKLSGHGVVSTVAQPGIDQHTTLAASYSHVTPHAQVLEHRPGNTVIDDYDASAKRYQEPQDKGWTNMVRDAGRAEADGDAIVVHPFRHDPQDFYYEVRVPGHPSELTSNVATVDKVFAADSGGQRVFESAANTTPKVPVTQPALPQIPIAHPQPQGQSEISKLLAPIEEHLTKLEIEALLIGSYVVSTVLFAGHGVKAFHRKVQKNWSGKGKHRAPHAIPLQIDRFGKKIDEWFGSDWYKDPETDDETLQAMFAGNVVRDALGDLRFSDETVAARRERYAIEYPESPVSTYVWISNPERFYKNMRHVMDSSQVKYIYNERRSQQATTADRRNNEMLEQAKATSLDKISTLTKLYPNYEMDREQHEGYIHTLLAFEIEAVYKDEAAALARYYPDRDTDMSELAAYIDGLHRIGASKSYFIARRQTELMGFSPVNNKYKYTYDFQ